jgi:hypothetical protein
MPFVCACGAEDGGADWTHASMTLELESSIACGSEGTSVPNRNGSLGNFFGE